MPSTDPGRGFAIQADAAGGFLEPDPSPPAATPASPPARLLPQPPAGTGSCAAKSAAVAPATHATAEPAASTATGGAEHGNASDAGTSPIDFVVKVVYRTGGGAMTVPMASSSSTADIRRRFAEEISKLVPVQRSPKRGIAHAVSRAVAAAAEELARSLVITCSGRVLRSSEETLADVCKSASDTIEVTLPLAGGMFNCLPPWMRRSASGAQERPASVSESAAATTAASPLPTAAASAASVATAAAAQSPKVAEEKAKKEAEEKAKKEAEEKAKKEEEEKAKKEAGETARKTGQKAEETAKQMAADKARREADAMGRRGRSIYSAELERLVRQIAQKVASSSEAWRKATNGGTRVTSHNLRSVFKNLIDPDDTSSEKIFPDKEPFHPNDW